MWRLATADDPASADRLLHRLPHNAAVRTQYILSSYCFKPAGWWQDHRHAAGCTGVMLRWQTVKVLIAVVELPQVDIVEWDAQSQQLAVSDGATVLLWCA